MRIIELNIHERKLLRDALTEAINDLGSQVAVARATNISQQALSQFLAGRELGAKTALKLVDYIAKRRSGLGEQQSLSGCPYCGRALLVEVVATETAQ